MKRLALYSRVSTESQDVAPQLEQLRRYAAARGEAAIEFTDHAVSGSRDSRPGLDALVAAARRREISAIVVVKLDRLARSVRHLVNLAAELDALGVSLVVLDQAIDTSTPAGRFTMHALAAVAELEHELGRERTRAALAYAKAHPRPGKKRPGRPIAYHAGMREALRLVEGGTPIAEAARRADVPRTSLRRELARQRAA